MVEDKQPCGCKPSCNKLLGPKQRSRHRKLLTTLDKESSSSDTDPDIRFDNEPTLQGTENNCIQDISIEDNLDNWHIGYTVDVEMGREHQEIELSVNAVPNSTSDMDAELGSSAAEDSESGTEEDDIGLEDLSPEDLIHVLQQKYDDEWQQKLHEFRA